jgi:hypothetical protein
LSDSAGLDEAEPCFLLVELGHDVCLGESSLSSMSSEHPTQLTSPLVADRLTDIPQTLAHVVRVAIPTTGSRGGKTGESGGVPGFYLARSMAAAHFGRSRSLSPACVFTGRRIKPLPLIRWI